MSSLPSGPSMSRLQHPWFWRQSVVLAALLTLLCLSVATVSHFHGNAGTGSVKNECQLCLASGLSRSLPANTQPLATVVLLFFLLLTPPAQPYSRRFYRSITL